MSPFTMVVSSRWQKRGSSHSEWSSVTGLDPLHPASMDSACNHYGRNGTSSSTAADWHPDAPCPDASTIVSRSAEHVACRQASRYATGQPDLQDPRQASVASIRLSGCRSRPTNFWKCVKPLSRLTTRCSVLACKERQVTKSRPTSSMHTGTKRLRRSSPALRLRDCSSGAGVLFDAEYLHVELQNALLERLKSEFDHRGMDADEDEVERALNLANGDIPASSKGGATVQRKIQGIARYRRASRVR